PGSRPSSPSWRRCDHAAALPAFAAPGAAVALPAPLAPAGGPAGGGRARPALDLAARASRPQRARRGAGRGDGLARAGRSAQADARTGLRPPTGRRPARPGADAAADAVRGRRRAGDGAFRGAAWVPRIALRRGRALRADA